MVIFNLRHKNMTRSPFFIRILIVWLASLLSFNSIFAADKSEDTPLEREVRLFYSRPDLPPFLNGLLVAMLWYSNVKGDVKRGNADRMIAFNNFNTVVNYLIHLYEPDKDGKRELYKGPKIKTITDYFKAVEPARFDTGTVRGDFEKMNLKAKAWKKDKSTVPHAVYIPLDEETSSQYFADDDIRTFVIDILETRAKHVQKLFQDTSKDSLGSPGETGNLTQKVVTQLLAAFAAQLSQPNNLAIAAEALADAIDNHAKSNSENDKPLLEIKSTPELIRTLATVLRSYGKIGKDEREVIKIVSDLSKSKDQGLRSTLEVFEQGLQALVAEIQKVGEQGFESRSLIGRQDISPRNQALQTVFREVPPLLDDDVLKDILMDCVRVSPDAGRQSLFAVLVRHMPTLIIDILQKSVHLTSGELAELAEMLQDENIPVPIEEAREIIRNDVNKYGDNGLDLESLRPLKVGKAAAAFTGLFNGIEAVILLQKPSFTLENLEKQRDQIILRLAEKVADAFFDEDIPKKKRVELLKKIINMRIRALAAEMEVADRARLQTEAASQWNREFTRKVEGHGDVTFVQEVPKVLAPAAPGSRVMIMKKYPGMPTKDFVRLYPQLADAFAKEFPTFVVHQLFASTDEHEVGYIHLDTHGGNFLFKKPSNIDGRQILGNAVLDWGSAAKITAETSESLLLLTVGAGLNVADIIADTLWDLRDKDADGDKEKLRDYTRLKTRELIKKKAAWGPDQWILSAWSNEIISVPDDLVNLEAAHNSLIALHAALTSVKDEKVNREAVSDIFNSLEKTYRPKAEKKLHERYPMFKNPLFWANLGLALKRSKKHSCQVAQAIELLKNKEQGMRSHYK